ncbi:MAG: hypothetical protein PHR64_01840 [Candidatus Shapirobacteria bacterium]|nr:hypothetical protein [Candidatus Shapirobacteria bacterium]MDD5481669.1 hypothetical protein [Candidatus Shapirobacteria bacterium]
MTNLNRQLGFYSSQKRNRLRQVLIVLIIACFIFLLILIGQQAYLWLKNNHNQLIGPEEEAVTVSVSRIAQEYSLPVIKIEEKPDMVILLLEGSVEIFLDKKKPVAAQLVALQLIINQDKINGRKAKRIDLRFNNPIAVY